MRWTATSQAMQAAMAAMAALCLEMPVLAQERGGADDPAARQLLRGSILTPRDPRPDSPAPAASAATNAPAARFTDGLPHAGDLYAQTWNIHSFGEDNIEIFRPRTPGVLPFELPRNMQVNVAEARSESLNVFEMNQAVRKSVDVRTDYTLRPGMKFVLRNEAASVKDPRPYDFFADPHAVAATENNMEARLLYEGDKYRFEPLLARRNWKNGSAFDAASGRVESVFGGDASYQVFSSTRVTSGLSFSQMEIERQEAAGSQARQLRGGLEQKVFSKLGVGAAFNVEERMAFASTQFAPTKDYFVTVTPLASTSVRTGFRDSSLEGDSTNPFRQQTYSYYSSLNKALTPNLDFNVGGQFDQTRYDAGQFDPAANWMQNNWQMQFAPSYRFSDTLSFRMGYQISEQSRESFNGTTFQPRTDQSVFMGIKLQY